MMDRTWLNSPQLDPEGAEPTRLRAPHLLGWASHRVALPDAARGFGEQGWAGDGLWA